MPIVDISLSPRLEKDIRESSRFAPIQTDMRNVRITAGDNMVKRNGYAEEWDTGSDYPVILLVPENDGYAFTENGKVYSLGTSVDEIKDFGSTQALVPQWVKWDDKIIVTTGNQPITIDGNIVTNLGGGPVNAKFISIIASYTFLSGHDDTEIRWSAPNNPANWTLNADGAGFTNIDKTGTIQHQADYNGRLYFFTENDIQVYSFKGAVSTIDSPIAKYATGTMSIGLGAKNSVVKARGDLYWFGSDGEFYSHNQGGTRIISGSMRRRLNDFHNLDSMVGLSIEKENLVQWTSQVDGITLSYDYSKDLWLEDNRWDKGWQSLGPFGSYMELNREQFYGSGTIDGLVHKWSEDSKDDNGKAIRVYRRLKHRFSEAGKHAIVRSILVRRRGSEAITGSVASPVFNMRWRFDGGAWSNWEEGTLGAVGEHDPYAAEFFGIGYGREIELELDEGNAVDFLLTNLIINYTEARK